MFRWGADDDRRGRRRDWCMSTGDGSGLDVSMNWVRRPWRAEEGRAECRLLKQLLQLPFQLPLSSYPSSGTPANSIVLLSNYSSSPPVNIPSLPTSIQSIREISDPKEGREVQRKEEILKEGSQGRGLPCECICFSAVQVLRFLALHADQLEKYFLRARSRV